MSKSSDTASLMQEEANMPCSCISLPPSQLRELYSADEWRKFEQGMCRWLGDSPGNRHALLTLDEALLLPTPYTYAHSVKQWMNRIGMSAMADRILPDEFPDTNLYSSTTEGE